MSAPSLLRSVPCDFAAERATLGAVLIDREAIVAVSEWLNPLDFYLEKHGMVYEAMLACFGRREPPDLVLVADELRRRDRLDLVGGISFLGELMGEVPTSVHVEHYAHIVEGHARRRRIIETGGQITALGYDVGAEVEDIAAEVERLSIAATTGRTGRKGATPLGDVMKSLLSTIDGADGRSGMSGMPTGYPDLDEMTGGLQPSDLILLAARPSVGKSALAFSLAYNIAHRLKEGVGIFSLEMSENQIGNRMLAMHTGIDSQRLHTGNLRDDELNRAVAGMGELSETPIVIDDQPGLTIRELQRRARRMKADHEIGILIVDYLQLMSGGKQENRNQEVSEISRGLKVLARELRIPVLALSQLSRAVEGRSSKIPMLSDLRESGSLEQDADVVMFIHREEMYEKDTDKKGIAELHIAKHRNGPLGVVSLRFEARTTRFHPMNRYAPPRGRYGDDDE